MLIPQVPEAPEPVGEGTSVPIARPNEVLAADAEVAAVPPLATANVPARVIVPVLVIGPPEVVKPVDPPETATEVTVPLVAGAAEAQVVPLAVRMLPLVVGATNCGAEVPLPRMTLLAVSVVRLVPPEATGRAAPRVNEAR
jgi:hypothetical protein